MSEVNVMELVSKANFRKAVKDLTDKEVQKIADNAAAILEERKAAAAEKEAAMAKRASLVTEVYEMLSASGMSKEEIEEALSSMGGTKKKAGGRATVAPKYKITDENGKEHTWTGRGKTPRIFAEYKAENNDSLDALAI